MTFASVSLALAMSDYKLACFVAVRNKKKNSFISLQRSAETFATEVMPLSPRMLKSPYGFQKAFATGRALLSLGSMSRACDGMRTNKDMIFI